MVEINAPMNPSQVLFGEIERKGYLMIFFPKNTPLK